MLKPQEKKNKQKVRSGLVSGVQISKRRVVTKEHLKKLLENLELSKSFQQLSRTFFHSEASRTALNPSINFTSLLHPSTLICRPQFFVNFQLCDLKCHVIYKETEKVKLSGRCASKREQNIYENRKSILCDFRAT